jgi:hypothetical protein
MVLWWRVADRRSRCLARTQRDHRRHRRGWDPAGPRRHRVAGADGDQDAAASTGVTHPTEDKRTQQAEDQGCSIDGEGSRQCRAQILGGKKANPMTVGRHAAERRSASLERETPIADKSCGAVKPVAAAKRWRRCGRSHGPAGVERSARSSDLHDAADVPFC